MKINTPIAKLLFLDIESIPGHHPLPDVRKAWEVFSKGEKDWDQEAALYAEFGQICCISVGYFNKEGIWSSKSYCGPQEKEVLLEFLRDLKKFFDAGYTFICGHNIKHFDIPFIIKRCTINGIYDLPECFELYGKKPWELTTLIDTLEIWRCGVFSGGGSLRTLCAAFRLPSPKEMKTDTGEPIDGKQVRTLFNDGKFAVIATYCEGDIKATANVFNKMVGNLELIFKEL